MRHMKGFFQGILVGIGGIAPGLSGSVMLLILGLYEKTINAISSPFKDFKKTIIFLVPLMLGFGIGVITFSKTVEYLLINFEFQTRYLFLGLVMGTVPLFYKYVKKKGLNPKHYLVIILSAIVGIILFSFDSTLFSQIKNPNVLQSVLLGVAVAGSSIIPGVDSAVILSAFGLYELYVNSIAHFNLSVLLPAGAGLILGVFLISRIMNYFICRFYASTFSVIFGLFISIIPKVLNESCSIKSFEDEVLAILLILVGFLLSFYLGDIKNNNKKISEFFQKRKNPI